MRDESELIVARPWPWFFSLVYTIHLLDEYLAPPGLPQWTVERFNFYFTEQHWLIVNVISLSVFWTVVWLVARGTWPSWVLMTLATHIFAHATVHSVASAWAVSLSPGLSSSLALSIPLAIWTFVWAARTLDTRVVVWSFLLGLATFQAPWDVLARLVFGLRWSAV